MEIKFHEIGQIEDLKIQNALIVAKHKNEWLLIRYKDKETFELPIGKRRDNEDINNTASRELFSSILALNYSLKQICIYEIIGEDTFGVVFYSVIKELDKLANTLIKERITTIDFEVPLTYDSVKEIIAKVDSCT